MLHKTQTLWQQEILIIVILLFSFSNMYTQAPDRLWQPFYGSTKMDDIRNSMENSQNRIIDAGSTTSKHDLKKEVLSAIPNQAEKLSVVANFGEKEAGTNKIITTYDACRERDSIALIAFYQSTNGKEWTIKWDLDQPMTTWFGITLDSEGCVRFLDFDPNQSNDIINLAPNNLSGSIPSEIGQLLNLERLNLGQNNLEGRIPIEISQLTKLRAISLSKNNLEGNIPLEIGNLSELYLINLSDNLISGPLPDTLYSLTNLMYLQIQTTNITGNIKPEIQQLKKLKWLVLGENKLFGTIPKEVGSLKDLKLLYLWNNQLTGKIPVELGKLSKLERLLLSRNQLTGDIPIELGNLSQLNLLYLWANELTGKIPVELGKLSKLEELVLTKNQLTGDLPIELGNLSQLKVLHSAINKLTGKIPVELGGLKQLEELSLSRNQLTGDLPIELGSLAQLKILYLWNNQLTGKIPIELGNLSKLEKLSLRINQLIGEIPLSLGALGNLEMILLADNDLSGCLPEELKVFCSLGAYSDETQKGYAFENNPKLPWEGELQKFCDGEEQFTASCDDSNSNTTEDQITGACKCEGEEVPEIACVSIIAKAGNDFSTCENSVQLAAENEGQGGYWTINNTGKIRIDDPANPYAKANNLLLGENYFIWTVESCQNMLTDTLIVTVTPDRIEKEMVVEICQGASYEGHQLPGSYIDTYKATNGCDSIRILHLEFIPNSRILTYFESTICEGESYEGHTETGYYVDYFKSIEGCDSIRSFELVVNDCISTHTKEASLGKAISVSPNPASEFFRVHWNEKDILYYSVFTISGKKIKNKQPLLNNTLIPTSSWARGIYLIYFKSEDKTVMKKVVIQ